MTNTIVFWFYCLQRDLSGTGVQGDGRGRDTIECVLLLQNVFSYYSATSVGLAWRVMGEDAMINVVYGALRNVDASLYAHLRSLLSNETYL